MWALRRVVGVGSMVAPLGCGLIADPRLPDAYEPPDALSVDAPPDVGLDAAADASSDAGPPDASSDAGQPDAPLDASSDTGRADAAPDAWDRLDTGTDVGVDAGRDAGVDAGHDAGVDAGRDAGVDAGRDAGVDAGRDAGMDAGRDAGVDAGRDAGVDAGRDAGVDAPAPSCTSPTGCVLRPPIPVGQAGLEAGAAVSVARDGSAIAFGAPGARTVYVAFRNSIGWSTVRSVVDPGGVETPQRFGASVAISNPSAGIYTLVVGAPDEGCPDLPEDFVGGGLGECDSGADGRAYRFTLTAGGLTLPPEELEPDRPDDEEGFGHAVAVSADGLVIAVSNPYSSLPCPTTPGPACVERTNGSGTDQSGTVWVWRSANRYRLKARQIGAQDGFGWSIALSDDGTRLAAGAPGDDLTCTASGVCACVGGGCREDTASYGPNYGMVTVHEWSSGAWQAPIMLRASGTPGGRSGVGVAYDEYGGLAIAADGPTDALSLVAVFDPGAPRITYSMSGMQRGVAYRGGILAVQPSSCEVRLRRPADDTYRPSYGLDHCDAADSLGRAVSLGRGFLAIGAPGNDATGAEWGLILNNEGATNRGAVYVIPVP